MVVLMEKMQSMQQMAAPSNGNNGISQLVETMQAMTVMKDLFTPPPQASAPGSVIQFKDGQMSLNDYITLDDHKFQQKREETQAADKRETAKAFRDVLSQLAGAFGNVKGDNK